MRYRLFILACVLFHISIVWGMSSQNEKMNFNLIRNVNSNIKSTWKAGVNENMFYDAFKKGQILNQKKVKRQTQEEEKIMLIYKDSVTNSIRKVGFKKASQTFRELSIPVSFDSRLQWRECISAVSNQRLCDSDWALISSQVLSDRFCIALNGTVNVLLSAEDLIACDKTQDNANYCGVGSAKDAWPYMVEEGIVPETCFPYTSFSGAIPLCPQYCNATNIPFNSQKYYAKSYSHIAPWLFWQRVSDIQNEVLANGPVHATFEVYEDFQYYKSGIYSHQEGFFIGNHAAKIIGWGIENGNEYWLASMTWSTKFGLDGYFKIRRGVNECGIEEKVYSCVPDLSRVPKK